VFLHFTVKPVRPNAHPLVFPITSEGAAPWYNRRNSSFFRKPSSQPLFVPFSPSSTQMKFILEVLPPPPCPPTVDRRVAQLMQHRNSLFLSGGMEADLCSAAVYPLLGAKFRSPSGRLAVRELVRDGAMIVRNLLFLAVSS